MAKIKLHNPELAKNSVFKNLILESLSVDPTLNGVENSGRLWFNTDDKTFKGSFLNEAGDNVEVKQIGIDNSAEVAANTTAIEQEVTDRTTADTTLQDNIDTVTANLTSEITNRTDADITLDNKITDLSALTGDLSTLTTDKKDTLVNALNETDSHIDINTTDIATIGSKLDTEINDRTTADTSLQNNIDSLTTDIENNYLSKTSTEDQSVAATTTFTQNLIIQGDLTVSGATTTVETEVLKVSDNIITLNNGIGDIDPTEDAGFEVDRGNAGITKIVNWNETLDQVEIQEAGELRKVASTKYVDDSITTTSNTLQTEIDNTQTGAGLETDGSYVADNTTTYLTEATDLKDADKKLDTQIKINTDNIGDLSLLSTDTIESTVKAINEIDAHTDTNASDIATETTNRVNADNNLQNEIDNTQTGAGLETDGSYTADNLTNYLTEATDLKDADKKLDTQIKTNVDDISGLDTRLTDVENEVNGKIGNLDNLTTDEKDTLVGAINEVDAHIDTEVTNRTTADTNLQTNIDTEVSDRTNADNAIGTRIDNVNSASGLTNDTYEADNTTNYLTDATDLKDADKKLDTQIKTNVDNLVSQETGKGTTLVGYEGYTESNTDIVNPTISIDAGTLKSSLDDIASSVNEKIYAMESNHVKGEVAEADKADTYTIAHNLDTVFVDVSVQVYDAEESVWRFDLVVTEVIDANTVKISLASGDAEQIRYVVQGY